MNTFFNVSCAIIVAILVTFSGIGVNGDVTLYENGTYIYSQGLTGNIKISKYAVSSGESMSGEMGDQSNEDDGGNEDDSNESSTDETSTSNNTEAMETTESTTTPTATTTTALAPSMADLKQTVTVEFLNITEVDENGNQIGMNETIMHSFSAFVSENFTLSNDELEETTYLNLTAMKGTIQHQMSHLSTSTLQVHFFFLQHSGEVDMDGTMKTLMAGQVVMRIEIMGWQWCGDTNTCGGNNGTNDMGAALMMSMSIKGSTDTRQDTQMTHKYELGPKQNIMLPEKAMIDNQWMGFPTGYPAMTSAQDSTFSLYFDMFQTSGSVDVVLDIELEDESTVTGSALKLGQTNIGISLVILTATLLSSLAV